MRTYMYVLGSTFLEPDYIIISDEGPMLETLDYIIRISSAQTFLYFERQKKDKRDDYTTRPLML